MAYYDDDIQTADELIREFGEPCKLLRLSTGVPANPDEPWVVPEEPSEDSQDVQCVFLPFGNSVQFFQGTEIPRGAKKILLSCVGLSGDVPLQAHIERSGGERWKIEALKLLDPNGQRVLYTLMGVQ